MIIFKIKEFPFVFMIAKEKKKNEFGLSEEAEQIGGGYTLMMSNA